MAKKSTASDSLLRFLQGGGHAVYERGDGQTCFGSDKNTYSVRAARSLERDGLVALRWIHTDAQRWRWAFVATQTAATSMAASDASPQRCKLSASAGSPPATTSPRKQIGKSRRSNTHIHASEDLPGLLGDASQDELLRICALSEFAAWAERHQAVLATGRKHGIFFGVSGEVADFIRRTLRSSGASITANLAPLHD